jgi:hypothetical protein
VIEAMSPMCVLIADQYTANEVLNRLLASIYQNRSTGSSS